MKSRTKYRLDAAEAARLFQSAGIEKVEDIVPLGAGEFNAVLAARAGEREYALKIAPAQNVSVMTYEQNMMEAEVFWYGQMREHSNIPVPQVFHTDFTRKLVPADFFIMERLPGKQFDQMEFAEEEKEAAASQLARMAASMHRIKNDKFGYIQNGLYDDWYQAIRAMVTAVIADASRKGRISASGERLLKYIDHYRAVLEKAECTMVNFDIWPANIMCSREGGRLEYAWIDPERSFWGDRIADFVCLEFMAPLPEKKASLLAYNESADKPVAATREENIRYAVAQGYIGLIMEVEKYYRYTPFHYGWWRNVGACRTLFGSAFGILERESL